MPTATPAGRAGPFASPDPIAISEQVVKYHAGPKGERCPMCARVGIPAENPCAPRVAAEDFLIQARKLGRT